MQGKKEEQRELFHTTKSCKGLRTGRTATSSKKAPGIQDSAFA